MTMNKEVRLRFPAEWEEECAVLVAWPHEDTDWSYMLDEIKGCYLQIVRTITRYQPVIVIAPETSEPRSLLGDIASDRLYFVDVPTNDTWTRDYGPITLVGDGISSLLDFCFNGWGMKFAADKDNLVNERLSGEKLFDAQLVNLRDFVLEGGGIESDGDASIMTTKRCQLSPNRNATLNISEIEKRLLDIFRSQQILWVNHGYLAGDDTDSHIDTLARFAPNGSIVYVGCNDPEDEHYEELLKMKHDITGFRRRDGSMYNLIELPLPDPVFDEEGLRLPATYANFLALPNVVIMPSYGQAAKDTLARQLLEVAFERPVECVDCRPLIKQHGSLHCATMQIPLKALAL